MSLHQSCVSQSFSMTEGCCNLTIFSQYISHPGGYKPAIVVLNALKNWGYLQSTWMCHPVGMKSVVLMHMRWIISLKKHLPMLHNFFFFLWTDQIWNTNYNTVVILLLVVSIRSHTSYKLSLHKPIVERHKGLLFKRCLRTTDWH